MSKKEKPNLELLFFLQGLLPPDLHIIECSDTLSVDCSEKRSDYKTTRRLQQSERDIYEHVKKELKNYLIAQNKGENYLANQSKYFRKLFKPQYQLGDVLRPIQKLVRITPNNKNSFYENPCTFIKPAGLVTLIYFWYNDSRQSFYPNWRNKRFLKDNPNWKGKVCMVGIYLGITTKPIFLKMQQQNVLEHIYAFEEHHDGTGSLVDALNIRFDDQVLLDQTGRIVYKGSPKDLDTEKAINELIRGDFQLVDQQKEVIQEQFQIIPKKDLERYRLFKQIPKQKRNLIIYILALIDRGSQGRMNAKLTFFSSIVKNIMIQMPENKSSLNQQPFLSNNNSLGQIFLQCSKPLKHSEINQYINQKNYFKCITQISKGFGNKRKNLNTTTKVNHLGKKRKNLNPYLLQNIPSKFIIRWNLQYNNLSKKIQYLAKTNNFKFRQSQSSLSLKKHVCYKLEINIRLQKNIQIQI